MFKLPRQLLMVRRFFSADGNPLQGTLHARFLDHLRGNRNFQVDPKLAMMLKVFREHPVATHSKDFGSRFKEIDNKTLEVVKSSDRQMISLLNELICSMPAHVTQLKFFNEATETLFKRFQRKPNRDAFVKLCFYLGLYKKQPPGPMMLTELIEGYLNRMIDSQLTEISTIDIAIICMAAYKASVRIYSKKFIQRVIHEVTTTKEIDALIFVSFIKCLRMNQINSPKVIEALRMLKNNKELNKLDYKSLIHVFPLIAENRIVDEELSGYFVERCIETLTEETRAKDVQKLLYSCALLNFPVKLEHLQTLQEVVMKRTDHKEYQQKFDNFVDVALSMWILNFRCRDLVEKLVKDSRFTDFRPNQNRVKIDSRKKLLESCIEIEEPTWIKKSQNSFDQHRPSPGYLIKSSMEKAMMEFKGKDAKFVQQIKNLNIAGILVKKDDGNLLNVEVLDDTNSLSNKTSLNGIFALKLRLLKAKGCDVRLVNFVSQ